MNSNVTIQKMKSVVKVVGNDKIEEAVDIVKERIEDQSHIGPNNDTNLNQASRAQL